MRTLQALKMVLSFEADPGGFLRTLEVSGLESSAVTACCSGLQTTWSAQAEGHPKNALNTHALSAFMMLVEVITSTKGDWGGGSPLGPKSGEPDGQQVGTVGRPSDCPADAAEAAPSVAAASFLASGSPPLDCEQDSSRLAFPAESRAVPRWPKP